MAEKKKKEPEKKKSLRGEKLRKAIEEIQKFRAMEKSSKASPAKKPVPKKEEESWVAKLKSKVQAYFKSEKKKKEKIPKKADFLLVKKFLPFSL